MGREIRGLRDVAGELVLIAAGGRAILLQLANPAIGHGVAEHSDFVARPLDRLTGTLMYSYTVAFGTSDEIAYVRSKVNRAHAPVRSTPIADGPGYNAFDPRLQLWVAATLYESATDMYRRIFGEIDDGAADRVYREFAITGTALQVPAELWPADRAAFGEYWRAELASLRVDDVTRAVAHELLHLRHAPRWLRPLMPLASLVTAGLLPTELREAFGFRWDARLQRRFDRWMRATAVVFPRLPSPLRHSLCIRYLRRLRREIAEAGQ
jgi:uncharacterized protein (DUF2236 family)